MKSLVGRRIIITKGEYIARIGTIEYCDKCCRNYRVQFDGIGNSERLTKFKGKYLFMGK